MKIKMTDYYTVEKIKAVKSVAKALIIYELESWGTEELTVEDTERIAQKACMIMDTYNCEFRYILYDWCYSTMKKEFRKLEGKR